MNLGLEGRTALVTGASRGIGLAIARLLAGEGVRVVLSSRNAARLAAVAGEIGGIAIPADVSRAEDIERLVAEAAEHLGGIDILVVNAGGPPPGTPMATTEEAWRSGWELTLMSSVRLARACVPGMRERRWGRVVNVTSTSVKVPIPNLVLSNAYRAAVTAFAKTLSAEVAGEGITVNNVAPGPTDTDRIRELYPVQTALDELAAGIPAGRLVRPEEVAAAAVFLASVPAAMITGQTIVVDGGAVGAL